MEAKQADTANDRPLFITVCLFTRISVFLLLGLYLLVCAGQVAFAASAGPYQIKLGYTLIFIGFVEIIATSLYQIAEKLFEKYIPGNRSVLSIPPLSLYPWYLLVGLVANAALNRFPSWGILFIAWIGFIVGTLIIFDVLNTGQGSPDLITEYEPAEESF